MMKASELRQKSVADLQALKMELLKEQFNLRMQKGSGQLTKNHLMGVARKNVARVKTILTEKAATQTGEKS